MRKRIIAIHLPQFHPFKENDEWWGKGFTEWTNVAQAKPRFKGHYQPHIPSDLGFYDLRLPETRKAQADLAKEYGIYGFCYYHYWFNGKQLMERPVEEILSSGQPNYPFMLCWANENWARNWDGGFKKILIEQSYSLEDDADHMRFLCSHVFCDARYIRINNKPVFVVYKPALFPDIGETIKVWRTVAEEFGLELYLCFMNRGDHVSSEFIQAGFDRAIDFQPHYINVIPNDKFTFDNIFSRIYNRLYKGKSTIFSTILSYEKYVNYECTRTKYDYYPCITPGWDNSPRRVKSAFFAFKDNTPTLYGKWLKHVLKFFIPFSEEENFVFINAWNEWAEGNHLEPDLRWGRSFLKETNDAITHDE